ncbi:hypothetical protein FHS14_003462 [Paenibacillus baekrokdamisoli]|nr:hypothetical protein [Paenibacillus baekrokdamisoli]
MRPLFMGTLGWYGASLQHAKVPEKRIGRRDAFPCG